MNLGAIIILNLEMGQLKFREGKFPKVIQLASHKAWADILVWEPVPLKHLCPGSLSSRIQSHIQKHLKLLFSEADSRRQCNRQAFEVWPSSRETIIQKASKECLVLSSKWKRQQKL